MYDNMHHANRTAVIKMAYKANNINDCFAAFDLLKARKSDLVMACMGSGGEITRILAPKFGNFITFASLDELSCSAPGQLTLAQMRKLYRFDEINADTELYGIIADPVGHSASPAVYNASFDKGGGNAVYLPLLTEGGKEGFDMFMENVLKRPWMDFRGFSVTIPHKNNAFEYVRKRGTVDAKALPIGAINTVAIDRNGEISGYNTDYAGALNPLKKALGSLRGRKVAIIGAGGVSKAVAAGLTAENADVTIFNRTVEKAKHLAETFGCKHDSIMNITRLGRENFEVVVNCTSIGMSPHVDASPVEIEQLDNRMTVFDTVYNPLETTLLKFARKAGAATITGFEMFVEQALEQYRLLTGKDADQKLIRTVLEEKLLKKDGNGQ
jgi:3-dehydroquinate dehydratase/shikimate dehydrogenase